MENESLDAILVDKGITLILVLFKYLNNPPYMSWVIIAKLIVKRLFFIHRHVLAKQEIAVFFQVRSQRDELVL